MLITSKKDTIEHIEIDRETKCKLFIRNHTKGRSNLSKNKLGQEQ
jgi:hypothetical protein